MSSVYSFTPAPPALVDKIGVWSSRVVSRTQCENSNCSTPPSKCSETMRRLDDALLSMRSRRGLRVLDTPDTGEVTASTLAYTDRAAMFRFNSRFSSSIMSDLVAFARMLGLDDRETLSHLQPLDPAIGFSCRSCSVYRVKMTLAETLESYNS